MTTPEKPALPSRNFDTIADYETWAAQNWLHSPGTIEAQLHARGKNDEETDELIDALLHGTPEEIISEAGDLLWTATASGSNAGISLSEVLHNAFPGYLDPSKAIATDAIDPRADSLFRGITVRDLKEYLAHNERVLGKNAKQWFVLKDTMNTPGRTFADALIAIKRRDAADALLNTVLIVSYIAQQYANTNLQTIMQENYRKIEERIRSGAPVTKPPKL